MHKGNTPDSGGFPAGDFPRKDHAETDSPRLSLPVRENKPNHAMVEENLSVYFLLEEKALLTQ